MFRQSSLVRIPSRRSLHNILPLLNLFLATVLWAALGSSVCGNEPPLTISSHDTTDSVSTSQWGDQFRSLGAMWRYQTILGTSPDGKKLLLGRYSKNLAVYELAEGRVTQLLRVRESVQDATYSTDGQSLAVAEWRDGFSIRDAESFAVNRTFSGTGGLGAWAVRFSPRGDQVYCYSWWHKQKQGFCFDLVKDRQLGWPRYEYPETQSEYVREHSGNWSPFLLSVRHRMERGRPTGFEIWRTDLRTGSKGPEIKLRSSDLYQHDIAPDGHAAIVVAATQRARLVDMETGETIARLSGHRRFVTGATFSPDGRWIASVAGTTFRTKGFKPEMPDPKLPTEIILHDAKTGKPIATYLDSERRDYYHVRFSMDGRYVIGITREKDDQHEVVLWGTLPQLPEKIDPLPSYEGIKPVEAFPGVAPIKILTQED